MALVCACPVGRAMLCAIALRATGHGATCAPPDTGRRGEKTCEAVVAQGLLQAVGEVQIHGKPAARRVRGWYGGRELDSLL